MIRNKFFRQKYESFQLLKFRSEMSKFFPSDQYSVQKNMKTPSKTKLNIKGSGRKPSASWSEVLIMRGENCFCKHCNSKISARVERIRSHLVKCSKFITSKNSNTCNNAENISDSDESYSSEGNFYAIYIIL